MYELHCKDTIFDYPSSVLFILFMSFFFSSRQKLNQRNRIIMHLSSLKLCLQYYMLLSGNLFLFIYYNVCLHNLQVINMLLSVHLRMRGLIWA